jgi:8-oxo-dGTP pyrophosphatase MutT (NUDIX family)
MEVDTIARILRTLRERLEPVERADVLIDTVEGEHSQARKAAVLLPLFVANGELSLLFIQRASTLRAHSGEMAFPGGSKDPTDASPVMTALREAHEEIGLEAASAEVLGLLPPVFTVVSNFIITPVVAYLPWGPGELQLQRSEVTEVVLAPLRELANPAIARHEQWTRGGVTRTVYFYDYGPYCIWGATGRMLNSLLQILS